MAFKVTLTERAVQDLDKLDVATRSLLLCWLKKNLDGCYNPRSYGYQLEKYNYNYWKYRLGDYRLLSLIEKEEVVILGLAQK